MVFINISVYKDFKKILDKDIKISAKNKEHLLMLSVSPFVLKSFFKLVALYPILIKCGKCFRVHWLSGVFNC